MSCILLGVFFLLACCKQSAPPAPDRQISEPQIIQTEQFDEEILRIAEDAQRTLPIFFRHLTRPDPKEDRFCVKYPFKADDQSGIIMEQIWLTGIHFKDGEYYGVLSVTPLYLNSMKKGDTVAFNADAITDWMYVRNEKIVGGHSIKYLLEKIPENERSEEQRTMLEMFEEKY